MELANKLKFYREQNGYSQAFVADHLHISRQSISKWENGKSSPDIEKLVVLSKLYEISIDQLLQENQQMTEKIKANEIEIKAKQKKLALVRSRVEDKNDEGSLLLILAGIAAFTFPIGIILVTFVFFRNKQTNTLYRLVLVVCLVALFLNLYDGYVHVSNFFDWGTGTVELID